MQQSVCHCGEMNDEPDAWQDSLIIYWVMSYGFVQLKIIRWVCLRQRAQCIEEENRLSKHSMSLIISNSVLHKGHDAFVINSETILHPHNIIMR